MSASKAAFKSSKTQITDPTSSPRDAPQRTMSYKEYLAWTIEGVRSEWVNGEVIVDVPPPNPHQTLVEFLDRLIGLFINIFDLGQLRVAPFELKITSEGSSREPDLMFIAKEHLDRLTNERVVGPPDLIIEIMSTDSVHRDRVDKFDEYKAGGVPEYWIIDNRPKRRRAWFYQLDDKGRYQSVPPNPEGIYRSRVLPGFWLRPNWLWQEQPNILRALAEVIGPEQVAQALQRAIAASDDNETQ